MIDFWQCGRLGKSHSPPNMDSGELVARHHRYNNSEISRKISSSTVGGRWDQMVLNKKARTGNPHTAEFVDMWRGWGTCLRTISQLNGNFQFFERGYSSRSLIDLPPPL